MMILNGLTKFVYGLYLLFTIIVLVSSSFINRIIFFEGTMVDQYHFPLAMVLLTIVILLLIYHWRKWLSTHDIWMLSLPILLVIGIFFLNLKFPEIVIDDARIISDSALEIYHQIREGTFEFSYFDQYYYLKYPWQIVLTLFEVGLHLLTNGNGTSILPWINLAAVIITYYCGYTILKQCQPTNCLSRNIYGLITILFIVPLTYSTYLYGWQLGMMFAALSLKLFTSFVFKWSNHSIQLSQLVFSLILWIIACLFKSNFVIIGIAYIPTLAWYCFKYRHHNTWIALLISCSALFIGLNANTWLYSSLIGRYEAGVPKTLYAVTGLSESPLGNGWYNGYNELYVQQDYDPVASSDIAKQDLTQRIDSFIDCPRYLIDFFSEKFVSTFLVKDYQSHAYYYWQQDTPLNKAFQIGNFHDLTYVIHDIAFLWIWAGLVLIGFIVLKHPNSSYSSLFIVFALCLLGASAYHMIFETKAIYIYPWVTLMLPFSALGFAQLIDHDYSIQIKHMPRYAIGTVIFCLAIFIYNQHPLVYSVQNLSYTDDQVPLEFISHESTIYTMSYIPSENYELGMIEFMTNGGNPSGQLTITVRDESNNPLSINTYATESLIVNEYWNRFVIDPVELEANRTYYITIEPHMNQDGLSFICGTYTQQPIVSRINAQTNFNMETNLYPNIKFYRFYHGHQSYEYLYDNVRAISTYYPQN